MTPASSTKDFAGIITLKIFGRPSNNAPMYAFSRPFAGSVGGCHWWIRVGPTLDRTSTLRSTEFDEASFDGERLIEQYKVFDSAMPDNGLLKIPASARIYQGNAPRIRSAYIASIWYATSSRCYFDAVSATNGSVISCGGPDRDGLVEDDRLSYRWKILGMNSQFPHEIELFRSGQISLAGTKWNPDLAKVAPNTSLPPPFDHGFVSSRYKVLESASSVDLLFPRRAIYETYGPLPGATGSNDTFVVVSSEMVFTNFTSSSIASSDVRTVEPVAPTTVDDYRFMDKLKAALPVKYLTSSNWHSVSSREAAMAVQRALVEKR